MADGTLQIPATGPDEGPFAFPSFGAAWRPFVIGAVHYALDNRRSFAGDEAAQDDIDLQIDHLAWLISQDVPTVATNTLFIPSQSFNPTVGAWTKNIDPSFGNRPQITVVNTTPLPVATVPLTLPAGNYNVWFQWGQFSAGAGMGFAIYDGPTLKTASFVNNYAAVNNPSLLDYNTLVLADDLDGRMDISPSIGFPGWHSPNTIAQLYNVAFERTG